MYDISVIVPVYNAEQYLEKTVDALLKQKKVKIEIILVNDGSQDSSEKLCDEFASKYDHIYSYSIQNTGPSGARNYGLTKANGEYIGFCDSDDLPNDNMYEMLLNGMLEFCADIALCDIYSERDGRSFGFPWKGKRYFEQKEYFTEFIPEFIGNELDDDMSNPVWGSVVRCLYRRDIICDNQLQFPEDISFAEDLVFTLSYMAHGKSACVCYEPLYYYVWNQSSIMNSYKIYSPQMFGERQRLVCYLLTQLEKMSNKQELRQRLYTTERCYFHECIGNACRKMDKHVKEKPYQVIKNIVYDAEVIQAFRYRNARNKKKKLLYDLIAYKQTLLLWLYYYLRVRT